MAKNPIFPLFYNDFDRSTRDWTDEEVGCYIRLLLHQWDKFGLPLGFDRLSRIANSAEKNWKLVGTKFIEKNGVLVNPRLEEIREERMQKSGKQRDNGKKGGRPKANENPNETQSEAKEEPNNEAKEKPSYSYSSINTGYIGDPEKTLLFQMVSVFKTHFPKYPENKEVDYPACLQIAYKIAEAKKWTKESVSNGKMDEILKVWDFLVVFSVTDEWFSTRSISDFNKEFQRLVQKLSKAEKPIKPKGAKEVSQLRPLN